MTEQELGSALRTVLSEAVRETTAVEEIFAEDTGADDATVYTDGMNTTVVLQYNYENDGVL